MAAAARRRVVVVHRRTELDELLDRHVTRGQVEFFLSTRGRTLADVQARHDTIVQARRDLVAAIPADWVTASVERDDLSRFLFDPADTIVVVGQDGLVANVAKYLAGQLVIGVNPQPGRNPGVLVRHGVGEALALALDPRLAHVAELATVAAQTDAAESLIGLNEVYVGHRSHQSARYTLEVSAGAERQSSSGLIVGTGAGSTGWCASLAHDRSITGLPGLTDTSLAWFVREAWPSPGTGVKLTSGLLAPGEALSLRVESDELVVFGDGVESDRLKISWGQSLTIGLGPTPVRLAL
jgi:hypothetical protein